MNEEGVPHNARGARIDDTIGQTGFLPTCVGTGPLRPRSAVYLHSAVKYHQAHSSSVTGIKRPRREGSHGLPAALSPLVTPSTPAVWTHIACAGLLSWLLPTTPVYAHPRGLRPGWHAQHQHFAQCPDMVRPSR